MGMQGESYFINKPTNTPAPIPTPAPLNLFQNALFLAVLRSFLSKSLTYCCISNCFDFKAIAESACNNAALENISELSNDLT